MQSLKLLCAGLCLSGLMGAVVADETVPVTAEFVSNLNADAMAVDKISQPEQKLPPPAPSSLLPLDQALVARANLSFALAIYQQLFVADSNPQNLVFSPASLVSALSMAYIGATGKTAWGFEDAMHIRLAQRPWLAALQDLLRFPQATEAEQTPAFQWHMANRLWVQQGYELKSSYVSLLQDYFQSELSEADFRQQPESARLAINQWVEQQTQTLIKDLLAPEQVSVDTRLLLVNAAYFKAAWETPFNPTSTRVGDFHLLDGSTVTSQFMHGRVPAAYAQGEDWEALELSYQGQQVAMQFLLPAPGQFTQFAQTLTLERLKQIQTELRPASMQVQLPRFELSFATPLKDLLSQLGMAEAFSEQADFSALSRYSLGLRLDAVVHQAVIKVDEAGTEAAAATGVSFGVTSLPQSIRFERPFIFIIWDKEYHNPLFIGHFIAPEST